VFTHDYFLANMQITVKVGEERDSCTEEHVFNKICTLQIHGILTVFLLLSPKMVDVGQIGQPVWPIVKNIRITWTILLTDFWQNGASL
jgi:hypothetical protein